MDLGRHMIVRSELHGVLTESRTSGLLKMIWGGVMLTRKLEKALNSVQYIVGSLYVLSWQPRLKLMVTRFVYEKKNFRKRNLRKQLETHQDCSSMVSPTSDTTM